MTAYHRGDDSARNIKTEQQHRYLPCELAVSELAEYPEQEDLAEPCMDVSNAPRRGEIGAAAKDLIRKEFGPVSPVIGQENRKDIACSFRHLSERGCQSGSSAA